MGFSCSWFKNENSAKTTIKGVVEKYTEDFKLFVKSRKSTEKQVVLKEVEFVLVLLPSEESSLLYDKLITKEEVVSLSSSIFLDERTRQEKEAFYISVIVEVAYD